MDIKKIMEELIQKDIIQSETTEYEPLSGGTVSNLYLLRNSDGAKYVLKMNQPQVIKSEAEFLNRYKDLNLLPKLLLVEPSNEYIIYSFITGSTNYKRKNKKELLKALVEGLINLYRRVPNNSGWGWADEVTDTWYSFLLNRIMEAKQVLDSHLEQEDYHFVLNLLENQKRYSREPYLLHGDCGVHNFIFRDGQFSGVIDPTPVIGVPLYDLIYAFCSSPDDLSKETIDSAVSYLLHKGHNYLYEEVIIGLYLRLGTCMKHHPSDFEEYLKAWSYWKDLNSAFL